MRDVALEAGFNSVLVVPLVDQTGILGSLVVLRQNAGEFSDNLIGLMKTFAHQAVLAMRNARLFTEVDHKSRELLAANDIVREQADKLQEQTDQLKDWNDRWRSASRRSSARSSASGGWSVFSRRRWRN